jgi:cytochrome c551
MGTSTRSRLTAAIVIFFTLIGCGDPKFDQYFVRGEQLYELHCSNCHQKNGKGLGLVYPPIDDSDFMEQNFEATLCLMKFGIKGEVTVNGKVYNQPMPGVPSLTDLEVAQIATYIYNSGKHKRGLIPVLDVEKIMRDCPQ